MLKKVFLFGIFAFITCGLFFGCGGDDNGDDNNNTAESVSIQLIVTNNTDDDIVRIDTHSGESDETIITEICHANSTETLPVVNLNYPDGYYFRWRFFNDNGDFFQPEYEDSDVPFNSNPSIYASSLENIFGPDQVSYDDTSKLITIRVTIDSFDNDD